MDDDAYLQDLPKILIVDDMPENLLAMEKILSALEVEIIRADSGEQALAIMLRHQFVVVLLDVKMPGMNGLETAALMQSHDQTMQTPVIFVTGYDMDELDQLEGYAVGATDYIIKPINPKILLSKVKIFLQLYLQSAELKHTNERLELSNADLEEFAYVASHDLKAPLRAIDNLASWIEEDLDEVLEGEPRQNLGLLRERIRRLENLLEDLLQYSRAGKGETQTQWVETAVLIEDIVELLDPPKDVAIVIAPDLPRLETSKAALEQVLRNLIGNAIN